MRMEVSQRAGRSWCNTLQQLSLQTDRRYAAHDSHSTCVCSSRRLHTATGRPAPPGRTWDLAHGRKLHSAVLVGPAPGNVVALGGVGHHTVLVGGEHVGLCHCAGPAGRGTRGQLQSAPPRYGECNTPYEYMMQASSRWEPSEAQQASSIVSSSVYRTAARSSGSLVHAPVHVVVALRCWRHVVDPVEPAEEHCSIGSDSSESS